MNENPDTQNRVPVAGLAVDACSAALDLVDVGAQRSADPQKWMAVAAPMCAQCEGVEDVGEAAGRILAAEVRRLNEALDRQQHQCALLHRDIGRYRAALDDIAELSESGDASSSRDYGDIARKALAPTDPLAKPFWQKYGGPNGT